MHQMPVQPQPWKRIFQQVLGMSRCIHRDLPRFIRLREVPGAASSQRPASDPLVNILYADNVVLAQIGARLDLDQIPRNLSRIFQAVHAAQRHEDRLAFSRSRISSSSRVTIAVPLTTTQCSARVKMLLQRKLRTRIDGECA